MSRRLVPLSGTVYTPQSLARAMVGAGVDSANAQWLDPCVGDGVFVGELQAAGIPRERIVAIDISRAKSGFDDSARTHRGTDFILWSSQHEASVDRVIMNPPYIALSKLHGAPLRRALSVQTTKDKYLPLKANYWCAFLLRAMKCLRPNGHLVAVLPAAWDFAQYAATIRDEVVRRFGDVVVVRAHRPLFPDVRDGSIVLVAKHLDAGPGVVRRFEVADLAGTTKLLESLSSDSPVSASTTLRRLRPSQPSYVKLGSIVDIRIGMVTGDARYFLLTEQQRIERQLPTSALKRVVSRSKHLTESVFKRAHWTALRDAGERVWLFRPTGNALKQTSVQAYLRAGKKGECNTNAYKVACRDPWHRTPLVNAFDGIMSGMHKRLPFLVLREMDDVLATNTLYVVRFRSPTNRNEMAAVGLALLSSHTRAELARRAHSYADGLVKVEPGQLLDSSLPRWPATANAEATFHKATELLLAGQESMASELADDWLAHGSSTPEEDKTRGHFVATTPRNPTSSASQTGLATA